MRLAANSSAIYFAITAAAAENSRGKTLEFKALDTELDYRQADLLANGQEKSPKPAMKSVGCLLVKHSSFETPRSINNSS